MAIEVNGMLAGKRIRRLGFGTMRLTGPGIWGPPTNEREAIALLRSVVSAGVQHIDTADAYGPHSSEELICKALYPYSENLLIATKGGFTRHGPEKWVPCGNPSYLRQCVELSLRRLKLETIDLYYLHRIDPKIPLVDQIGELERMRCEGKIKSIGLSKVDIPQIEEALTICSIEAIQNKFSYFDQEESKLVVKWCEQSGIAFVPYAPLAAGECFDQCYPISKLKESIAPSALAWLLKLSPAIFPIPGTSNIAHFKENLLSEKWDFDFFHC